MHAMRVPCTAHLALHFCAELAWRLQVRSDCAPRALLDYLTSDTAEEAEEEAISISSREDEEAALLQEVRSLLATESACVATGRT